MNPIARQQFVAEVARDVETRLAVRPIGLKGAVDWSAKIAPCISAALDIAISVVGPALEAATIAQRDTVRKFVSDRTLDYLSGLLHDLQAVSPQA